MRNRRSKPSKSPKKPKDSRTVVQRQPSKGRRFTAEKKERALVLVAAGMKQCKAAKVIGTTVETLRRWADAEEKQGALPEGLGQNRGMAQM